MILVIQICKETFHYFEFVKPIEDIIKKMDVELLSLNYKKITKEILQKADRIIICGTSLKDNGFIDDVSDFSWIKNFNKPILGICGGMHILGLIYGGKLNSKKEIGLKEIEIKKDFFGIVGKTEVYELHNFYVESNEFDVIATSNYCPQVIIHKTKSFYAVLFHPEVRNKKLVENFVKKS